MGMVSGGTEGGNLTPCSAGRRTTEVVGGRSPRYLARFPRVDCGIRAAEVKGMPGFLPDRRSWLKTTGLAALGVAANSGCVSGAVRFASSVSSRDRFARVLISPERVIRTVTGLRPFRSSGFVVRAERRDPKVIIHNYGHGGGGVTLSWGTAHLALDEARQTGQRIAAVLGCGAIGLASARLLQRHGWTVTVYARELPPDTTSNVAGAIWDPFSVFEENRLTAEFTAQFLRAAHVAYRAFQDLVGDYYGVRWIETYAISSAPPVATRMDAELKDVIPDSRELTRDEHPFRADHVQRFASMLVEPSIYLAAVLRDFYLAGGHVVVQDFQSVEQIMALPEPVIVNCTGLGAKALFGDEELIPIKGQLCILLPQPEVDYTTLSDGFLYMMPRRDGIVLGGTHEFGVWDLTPDPVATARILAGNARLFRTWG
ncbi:MAG TPA: FAD-dependent oxidoreductase [Gemmatimonadales bacterium]|nr:FAD-dependent oxidoreductase [Gemmatimonadales bacterium]